MLIKQKHWYPWLVVALLWGVALLNYMDRQMLSTMKSAIMGDIHELERAENFGHLMAALFPSGNNGYQRISLYTCRTGTYRRLPQG
jgi:hypothetical protein